jgi:hypothetical protein
VESAIAVLRRRAGTIAGAIVRRAPDGSVALVFAGGSLARGAVWAARVDGILEIYSDVDLYVVVEKHAEAAIVRAAVDAALRDDANDTPPGMLLLRGVDAGVYTPSDLRAQPVRPGTADLREHSLVLHGDATRLADLLPPVETMWPEEALHLLENRAWDVWPVEHGDPARERLARVMEFKVSLDIAAAYMILSGAQAQLIADTVAGLRAGIAPMPEEVYAAASRAADAREHLEVAFRDRREDVRALERLSRAWRDVAPTVMGMSGTDVVTLVARRCSEGRHFANAREFVRTAGCLGMTKVTAMRRAPGCSVRSPRSVLRMHALARVLLEGAALAAHESCADAVTGALGFNVGTLDERVRAAHRALS